MPITLVTGLPGHGKTLYTIARWKAEAEKDNRPVFHNDIPGLSIPGWRKWEVKEWEKLPAGALFIIDEAWEEFPVTGRGQTPDWVQNLAKHRHLGLDFVVIVQNPMLLDNFVRKLVDRHFHVVRKFGTHFATIYEYVNGCKEDVAKSRGDGIRHEFRYPKDVFELYRSAELHTVKRRIPARVFLLLLLPPLVFGLIWFGYKRMQPDAVAERVTGKATSSTPQNTGATTTAANFNEYARSAGQRTAAEYVAGLVPRIEGLAHTAPAYDGVTQPQQAPYPAACVATAKRCQCYTQQATKLDMRESLCRQLADGGFFVAWSASGERVQQPPRQPEQRPPQDQQIAAGSLTRPAPQFAPAQVDPDAGSLPKRVRRATQ